jgi:hypothetical protein
LAGTTQSASGDTTTLYVFDPADPTVMKLTRRVPVGTVGDVVIGGRMLVSATGAVSLSEQATHAFFTESGKLFGVDLSKSASLGVTQLTDMTDACGVGGAGSVQLGSTRLETNLVYRSSNCRGTAFSVTVFPSAAGATTAAGPRLPTTLLVPLVDTAAMRGYLAAPEADPSSSGTAWQWAWHRLTGERIGLISGSRALPTPHLYELSSSVGTGTPSAVVIAGQVAAGSTLHRLDWSADVASLSTPLYTIQSSRFSHARASGGLYFGDARSIKYLTAQTTTIVNVGTLPNDNAYRLLATRSGVTAVVNANSATGCPGTNPCVVLHHFGTANGPVVSRYAEGSGSPPTVERISFEGDKLSILVPQGGGLYAIAIYNPATGLSELFLRDIRYVGPILSSQALNAYQSPEVLGYYYCIPTAAAPLCQGQPLLEKRFGWSESLNAGTLPDRFAFPPSIVVHDGYISAVNFSATHLNSDLYTVKPGEPGSLRAVSRDGVAAVKPNQAKR